MIHPTAVIEPGAQLADGVQIGPFCHIGNAVVLENNVRLEAHVIIAGPVTIESDVRLFSFVKIGNGHCTVRVGTGSHIREFSQIGNQNDSPSPVRLGERSFIMAYTQIFPGVTLGDDCILTNAVTMQEESRCEERVIIGGLSSISERCSIGTGVMVGGASNLTHDIPPFCLAEGNPARVRGLNIIGLKRRFADNEVTQSVKRSFKQLHKNFNADTASELARTLDNPQAKRFAEFIAQHHCESDEKPC